jgi:hypothetical protein
VLGKVPTGGGAGAADHASSDASAGRKKDTIKEAPGPPRPFAMFVAEVL